MFMLLGKIIFRIQAFGMLVLVRPPFPLLKFKTLTKRLPQARIIRAATVRRGTSQISSRAISSIIWARTMGFGESLSLLGFRCSNSWPVSNLTCAGACLI